METLINTLNGIIWSPLLVYIILAAGVLFSIASRFMQIRHFGEMWRLLFKGKSSAKGISSFQAFAVALSGRVGIGNITGVAAAIGFGGPGAIFWMWITAFFGAATAYVETTMGQIYKRTDRLTGEYRGGPAYCFERCRGGKGWKIYASIFAGITVFSGTLFLPGLQADGIVRAVTNVIGEGKTVSTGLFGEVGTIKLFAMIVLLIVHGYIIFGGIRRIAHFAQMVVPFMTLAYVMLALIIIFANFSRIPELFGLIIGDAFTPMAGFGAAIGWGVKRGLYSNEAGQGSQTQASSAAEVDHPAQQGIVQALGVYVDTLLACSATAFVILITGMYNVQGTLPAGQFIIQHVPADLIISTPDFTQAAFNSIFGVMSKVFVSIAIILFAITTAISYYYYSEVNLAWIVSQGKGKANFERMAIFFMRILTLVMIAYAVLSPSKEVLNLSDIGTGMMAWINVVGILTLFFLAARPTMKCLADYERQKKAGVAKYTFDPEALGISNAHFWKERLAKERDGE